MLKYQKLKKNGKPNSLLPAILAGGQLLLVVAGLVGVSVEFFRDQGWLKRTLSTIMNTSTSTLVIALPVILLVFLVGKSWLTAQGESKSANLVADAMLYGMMLIGAWVIFKFVTEGGI
jgi:membrane protein insertase Oxa1/YidC/SpoIIIJ